MKTAKREQGFTLIELMVAATIGLIIIAGVMTLLTTTKRTYSFQQQMARVQENARFAIDFIGHGLRMSGYLGCSRSTLYSPNPSVASSPVFPITSLAAVDGGAGNVNYSDTFMVAFLETDRNAFAVTHCPRDPDDGRRKYQPTASAGSKTFCGDPVSAFTATPLLEGLGNGSTPIVLDRFGAQRGDLVANPDILLAAADCRRAEVYRVSSVSDTALNVSYPERSTPAHDGLTRDYNNSQQSYGAELRQLVTQRFFVALNGDGEPSLYRDNGIYRTAADCTVLPTSVTAMPSLGATMAIDNCYAEELVEGVESMQVRWGEDTDGDWVPNIYRTAGAGLNWDKVISAEVTLLMRTGERFDRDKRVDPDDPTLPYDYSAEVDPGLATGTLRFNDFRSRVIFRTVIELRNKTLVK